MKVLFTLVATAAAMTLPISVEASPGMPKGFETVDYLWRQYNNSCKQGEASDCELRDHFEQFIKNNYPNAVPAYCPTGIERDWFETGRDGMRLGCQMPELG